jgi:hypothetical protein
MLNKNFEMLNVKEVDINENDENLDGDDNIEEIDVDSPKE